MRHRQRANDKKKLDKTVNLRSVARKRKKPNGKETETSETRKKTETDSTQNVHM